MSFIRDDKVDIMRYLPVFLQKNKIFKATNDADSEEHDRLRLKIDDLLKQFNVDTATWGLIFYEDYLGITEPARDIKERREAIKRALNRNSVSTKAFMEALANKYIVDKSAQIVELEKRYSFNLIFSRGACWNLSELKKSINMYKPAHLGYTLYEQYEAIADLPLGGVAAFETTYDLESSTAYEAPTVGVELSRGGIAVFETDYSIGGV